MHSMYISKHMHLSYEKTDRHTGLFLQIANKEKHHAISEVVLDEMHNALDRVERLSDNINFVVFYPEFDRLHVGADVREFADDISPEWARDHTYSGVELDIRIKDLSRKIKTMAIMFGNRYGGSVEWPLMADYIICDDRARIQFTESHLGLIPGWSGIYNLMLKSTPLIAEYLAKTGNPIDAEQMYNLGIVDEIVEVPFSPEAGDYKEGCKKLFTDAAFDAVDKDKVIREPETEFKSQYFELLNGADKGIKERADIQYCNRLAELPGKLAEKIIKEKGKPIAPLAVNAVDEFIKKTLDFGNEELKERPGFGYYEADLCNMLMQTEDRKIGVNAFLNKEIAMFKGR